MPLTNLGCYLELFLKRNTVRKLINFLKSHLQFSLNKWSFKKWGFRCGNKLLELCCKVKDTRV